MEITRTKKWIGHTLRRVKGVTERDALDWKPQGSRSSDQELGREQMRKSCKRGQNVK
jgi:hypothetical protein